MRSRPRPTCPSVLDGPDSDGGKETEKAITFFAKPGNRTKTFKFKA
jgi:hypothetical protein